jgi:Porin PorA
MSGVTTASARGDTGRRSGGFSRRRLILASMGAFLLVFGLLLRLYVAPQLVAAPVSIYQKDQLLAPGSTYFDQATLTTMTNRLLTFTITVRGDPAASTSTTAVWDSFSLLADPKNGYLVSSLYQRAAFNRRNAQLSNCCGAALNDNTQIRQHGIGVFWPIGLQKRTYEVFDANASRAFPAHFRGVTTLDGVTVYKFTQHIPNVLVSQMPGVPASLLGLPAGDGSIVANRFFTGNNTFLVDPRTGVAVYIAESILSVLHNQAGQGSLTAVKVNLKLSKSSSSQLAALANKEAAMIAAVRVTGPLGLGVLGLILILAATVRPGRRRRYGDDDDEWESDEGYDGYEADDGRYA